MAEVTFIFDIDGSEEAFTERVVLDNVTYQVSFYWNERDEAWWMYIGDLGEDPTVGFKLTTFTDVLRPYRYREDLPQGVIFLFGNTDPSLRVGKYTMSQDVKQIYMVYVSEG